LQCLQLSVAVFTAVESGAVFPAVPCACSPKEGGRRTEEEEERTGGERREEGEERGERREKRAKRGERRAESGERRKKGRRRSWGGGQEEAAVRQLLEEGTRRLCRHYAA